MLIIPDGYYLASGWENGWKELPRSSVMALVAIGLSPVSTETRNTCDFELDIEYALADLRWR